MVWHLDVVRAFLVDSGSAAKPGGTGETFDWDAAAPVLAEIKRIGRVVAAGGLSAENIAEAIAILKPWGVDVVSGVEARPGKKDPGKVRAFVRAVREIDRKVS
jgi:phosphoribosylanthranilate isomerase